jgi:hypothetical protein
MNVEMTSDSVKLELYSLKFRRKSFIRNLNANYDDTINVVIDKALRSVCKSQSKDGLLQILSFLFISVVWTIANGWYAYSVVFTGFYKFRTDNFFLKIKVSYLQKATRHHTHAFRIRILQVRSKTVLVAHSTRHSIRHTNVQDTHTTRLK